MRTHQRERRIKPPKFDLEDLEDRYTFYVMILGISEDLFWNADVAFVEAVVQNKTAYDNWVSYVHERENKRKR